MDKKYDGMVLTGVNARCPELTDEDFWGEITAVLDWSRPHVFSSLFLCWGGMAGLKHFYDIDSPRGKTKLHGVFEHKTVQDSTGLLEVLPDRYPMPLSRWRRPDLHAIRACPDLEIASLSKEAGANVLVRSASYADGFYPKEVYVFSHPEYETDALEKEFMRDKDSNSPVPKNYFPDDNPNRKPLNTWRHTGTLYTKWVEKVYAATPVDLYHLNGLNN